MTEEGNIIIHRARVNNLKDVTVEIPRGKFTVITGISGSGKSSLAFDTLFAEGQRRFAESLSSYARQFLGRMSKPDVELIEGIPPAIAIEQKVNTRNPRSTIATSTEIYDYLRMIYARIGRTYSPVTGEEVKCHTVNDVMSYVFEEPTSTSYILSDLKWDSREDKVELMLRLKEEGYTRFFTDKVIRIEEVMKRAEDGDYPSELYLLVDRVREPKKDDEDLHTRLHASIEIAFEKGDGVVLVRREIPGQAGYDMRQFISRFEADGMTFEKPDEYLFSFNSPLGACPVCGGLGKIIGISEDLVVPDKSKTIYDGAIACWRGDKMGWFKDLLVKNAARYGIPIFEPYCNLSQEVKDMIWKGVPADTEDDSIIGLNEFFRWVESNRYKIQYKYMLNRYSGRTICQECGGSRLRKEALYVKVGGKNIHELLCMNVNDLLVFLESLSLDEHDFKIANKAIDEIKSRLIYIQDVGLGYLTLNRTSNTLSGGESQRINLVTALGSSLVGSLYILDEPSIGLHPRDTERLIGVLRRLRDIGNTVVFEDHDPRQDICSYIELELEYEYEDLGTREKPLIYRFYLGENRTSLNIERNCHYHINICPHDDGLNGDGWRVDKSGIEFIGTPGLVEYPESYIIGDIGDKIHLGCLLTPSYAPFDIGISYLEADKAAGIYDYTIDDDGHGVTLTLKSPGTGLIYMEAGEPINDSALFIIEVNLPKRSSPDTSQYKTHYKKPTVQECRRRQDHHLHLQPLVQGLSPNQQP